MNTLVLIPTYNERDNIAPLVKAVLDGLPDAGVLIIDDKSPDGTGEIADVIVGQSAARVSVLHRKCKVGPGRAYVDGYRHTLAAFPEVDFLTQMDADYSHDPSYLAPILEMAQTCDVAVDSRYVTDISIVNWPLDRFIVSKLATWFAKSVTGLPVTDCTAGLKCFRRKVLESIDLSSIRANGYVFQIETRFRAWLMGFILRDFTIIFYDRRKGESKLHLNIALETLLVVLRLGISRLWARRAAERLCPDAK